MPNIQSAKKALRQAAKRAARNKVRKDAFKDAVKKVAKAASKEDALKLVSQAQQALDKAVKTGVIKAKTASRKLSRLVKKVNSSTK